MADRIQNRRDTKARWAEVNPILLEGEHGDVLDDPNLYKVGDGVKRWNELPFRGYNGTIVNVEGVADNVVISQKGVTDALKKRDDKIVQLEQEANFGIPLNFAVIHSVTSNVDLSNKSTQLKSFINRTTTSENYSQHIDIQCGDILFIYRSKSVNIRVGTETIDLIPFKTGDTKILRITLTWGDEVVSSMTYNMAYIDSLLFSPIEEIKNIQGSVLYTDGCYRHKVTGAEVKDATNTYKSSALLPISPDIAVSIRGIEQSNAAYLCCYDDFGRYMATITPSTINAPYETIYTYSDLQTIAPNCKYIAGSALVSDSMAHMTIQGNFTNIYAKTITYNNKQNIDLHDSIIDNFMYEGFVDKRNGNVNKSDTSYVATGLIPFYSGIVITGYDGGGENNVALCSFFDRSYAFISAYTTGMSGEKTITIQDPPKDAVYVKVTAKKTQIDKSVKTSLSRSKIDNGIAERIYANKDGYFVHKTTGVITPVVGYRISDFIPVVGMTRLVVKGYDSAGTNNTCLLACFDINRKFLGCYTNGVAGNKEETVTTSNFPIGTYYIIITAQSANEGYVIVDATSKNASVSNLVTRYHARVDYPCVSFISDDGERANDWFLTILDEFDLKASFAIIGERMMAGSTCYNRKEVFDKLIMRGHEVMSHAYTADLYNMPSLSDEQLDYELGKSKLLLMGLSDTTLLDGFVMPGGQYDDRVGSFVEKYYTNAYKSLSDSDKGIYNRFPLQTRTRIGRINFDAAAINTPRLEILKQKIDEIAVNPAWLVFNIHPHYAEYTSTNTVDRKQELRLLLQYIISKNIPILTAGRAFKYFDTGSTMVTPDQN